MSGARFVRLYPSDWRSGCIGMTLEQEGLYIRVCTYIYETGLRLSLDDSKAAKFLGLHTNAYTKVRKQLAALGKLTAHADGWTVARAERELAAATNQKGAPERQADQNTPGETCQDTLGVTPIDTPQVTPLVTTGVFSENDNKINGPLKSLKPVALVECEGQSASAKKDSSAREGEEAYPHGVFVNCQTIRHVGFTISLGALELGVGGRFSKSQVKAACLVHALQWAAEIEGGKRADQVVPSKIANFLSASLMGDINRAAIADVRTQKAATAPAFRSAAAGQSSGKPTVSELLKKRSIAVAEVTQ